MEKVVGKEEKDSRREGDRNEEEIQLRETDRTGSGKWHNLDLGVVA